MMKNLQFGLILLCLLFFFSCQKEEAIIQEDPVITTEVALENIIGDDPLMDKFFNGVNDHDVPVSADKKATVDRIKLAMAEDHKTTPFVGDYIRQVGFPLWGQAKLHQQADGDFLYALPFAKANSTFTTAILHIALQQEAFVYELALRTDINEYLAAYSNGSQTFYWENLLAFLAEFNEYDNRIFNFNDSLFLEWFGQNKDSYLTDAADTRGCDTYVYSVCVWNITLQESGDTRSSNCDGTTYEVVVTICGDSNNPGAPSAPSPHTPGGQTGGVPGIGSGGGSSSSGGDAGRDGGPGTAPEINPDDWRDEGSNEPGDIRVLTMLNFEAQLQLQNQLDWYMHDAQLGLRLAITSRIFGPNGPDLSIYPNAHVIVDIMEEDGVDFDSGAINFFLDNSLHLNQVKDFLDNHENTDDSAAARDFAEEHGNALGSDAEYAAFIESTAGFTPVMWAIAKELIGDKVIDIVLRFIPGFGQADNVKDAIKAISHGDPLEFFFEVSQIVLNNSPLGNWLKAWNAVDELHDLYKNIDRIWDRIGTFSEAAITRLWDIAKHSPLKLNPTYLKYVGDLPTPRFGNGPTLNHLTNFDRAFPSVRVDMQVHHAYPQRAFNSYPQLGVTGSQLHSLENLRGIKNTTLLPGTNTRLHTHITNMWQQQFFPNFVATGTVPSVPQIQAFAKIIDDDFGHLFTPPIR